MIKWRPIFMNYIISGKIFKVIKSVVLCALAFSQINCASLDQTFRKHTPPMAKTYIGIRSDLAMLGGKTLGQKGRGRMNGVVLFLIWPVLLIDIPLSFALDTAFLPYTIPQSLMLSKNEKKKPHSVK
ncbi:MAG: YceK/YidQ family lipoprotein [Methylococcaceae bacterium]